jgi:hypothetical protein
MRKLIKTHLRKQRSVNKNSTVTDKIGCGSAVARGSLPAGRETRPRCELGRLRALSPWRWRRYLPPKCRCLLEPHWVKFYEMGNCYRNYKFSVCRNCLLCTHSSLKTLKTILKIVHTIYFGLTGHHQVFKILIFKENCCISTTVVWFVFLFFIPVWVTSFWMLLPPILLCVCDFSKTHKIRILNTWW